MKTKRPRKTKQEQFETALQEVRRIAGYDYKFEFGDTTRLLLWLIFLAGYERGRRPSK